MSQVDILLVDDYEENLLALEAILSDPAYTLVRASSGRAALKEVLRRDFALILLDVAMPDLDGYETAELIRGRERSRETPIIFLTANYRSDSHVFRGYSVGAVDYLFKPFSPEILKSKVAVFVELYQKREALKRQTQALLRAQEELEERVRARTRELAAANESLSAEVEERKRIEGERLALLESERSARAQAEAVNRLKDEFLATLSHELRTPLNAILGWSHLLASAKRDAVMVERAIAVIRNNAMAQSQLIEDILDVSRIIGGKLRLNLGSVQLREVIDAALDTVSPAADAKEIQVHRELEEVAEITGDQDRLQQIVWNLLSNAVKFTPREGHVTVRLRRERDDVELSVADTGIGIPRDFLPYVFDRFSQADGSATRRHGGLGLGMAIVRYLVELHGGTVRAESEGENRGTTFTLRLPMRLPAEASAPAANADAYAAAGDLPHLDGARVLIVDEDPDSRQLVAQLLAHQGATIAVADTTADAWSAFQRTRPDVLVADLSIATDEGYSLIRRVRALSDGEGGNTRALALTGFGRGQDSGALAAGFDRAIAKPVNVTSLIAVVSELTSKAEATE